MARLNEDAERVVFERELFRPPHAARMTEHAGRFVERLDREDKDMLLEDALERLWQTRAQIKEAKDVLTVWIKALEYAAARRMRWRCWYNVCHWRWVKGVNLGKEFHV